MKHNDDQQPKDTSSRQAPRGDCWVCDVVLAVLWAPIAFVLNVGSPRSFKRGDRLLFIVFWSTVTAVAVIFVLGRR